MSMGTKRIDGTRNSVYLSRRKD